MTELPRIVGLGCRARSGKDTVADYLCAHYGYRKTAFANALKAACGVIFGLTESQLYGDAKEVPDPYWSKALGREVTPRWLLQYVGTELFREHVSPDIWVHALGARIARLDSRSDDRWVVADVRFPNEAEAIKAWGGVVWRVDRPGAAPKGGIEAHASEVSMDAYDGWNATLANDGTFRDLYAKVRMILDV